MSNEIIFIPVLFALAWAAIGAYLVIEIARLIKKILARNNLRCYLFGHQWKSASESLSRLPASFRKSYSLKRCKNCKLSRREFNLELNSMREAIEHLETLSHHNIKTRNEIAAYLNQNIHDSATRGVFSMILKEHIENINRQTIDYFSLEGISGIRGKLLNLNTEEAP